MADSNQTANDAVQQLDRLGAVILDDVGDGPPLRELAAAANTARDAVAKLAVPALVQLTGLVASVADALGDSSIEWSPSIGGTLMAAVDDLRHLSSRADQFSDEDGEHLHHRAAELSAFVPVRAAGPSHPTPEASAPAAPPPAEIEVAATESKDSAKTESAASPPSAPSSEIVPIANLFFSDGGPHILSGGTPQSVAKKSELLGRGIDALDKLVAGPIASRTSFGPMEVVPVETIVYRGRSALERAAALREQIRGSGSPAPSAMLDEMYDLIGLALKD